MNKAKRRCRTCREEASSNAFPRGSADCHGCRDARQRRLNREKMPRMLARLRDRLDELARDNDWEHRFVTGLIERFETGEIKHLTDKQFGKVDEIYRKYEAE